MTLEIIQRELKAYCLIHGVKKYVNTDELSASKRISAEGLQVGSYFLTKKYTYTGNKMENLYSIRKYSKFLDIKHDQLSYLWNLVLQNKC